MLKTLTGISTKSIRVTRHQTHRFWFSSIQNGNYLMQGEFGGGLTSLALSRYLSLIDEGVDPNSILILSNRDGERFRVQETIDMLAPLSSVETQISGLSSFVRDMCREFPDIYGGKEFSLINRREELIFFEANHHSLLPNGSLLGSTTRIFHSILSKINLLKSHGITPSLYSSQLQSLYASTFMNKSDIYYRKYAELGVIYSLFDQLLKDHSFVQESDVLYQIKQDEVILDSLARQHPHLIVLSIESLTPIQRQFIASLAHRNDMHSTFLTHHTSLLSSYSHNPASIFADFTLLTSTNACAASSFMSLLKQRFEPEIPGYQPQPQQQLQHKSSNKIMAENGIPKVVTWDSENVSINTIRINECYSAVEENEEIIDRIKTIFASPHSGSISPTSPTQPLYEVIATESRQKCVDSFSRQHHFNGTVLNSLVGVFFKTQGEVNQFCKLLDQAGLSYYSREEKHSLYEGINILRVLYDPESPSAANFVDILQLSSLNLHQATVNSLIRKNQEQGGSLFQTIQIELRNSSSFLQASEHASLQLLVTTIQSLHSQLLQFYSSIIELPLLLKDSNRQSSLLSLLNELLYLEDGHSPLLANSTISNHSFKKLHDYIELLQFLPLFPSKSLVDHMHQQQGHPLMKLLLSTEGVSVEEKEEFERNDPNKVIVGTYYDVGPYYFDHLFLPQLNATRIPSRRTATSAIIPTGILCRSNQTIPYTPLHADYIQFPLILSRSLFAPYLSFCCYSHNGNYSTMKPAKCSKFLAVLLGKKRIEKEKERKGGEGEGEGGREEIKGKKREEDEKKITYENESIDLSSLQKQDDEGNLRWLLSVSRFNKYQQCKYSFYLDYILHTPKLPSVYLSYGSAMHHCIEDFTPLLSLPAVATTFSDRISSPPTDHNIMAVLNNTAVSTAAAALLQRYREENEIAKKEEIVDENVLRAVLRHYWHEEEFQPKSLEKTMKLRYYNGLIGFLKRDLVRACDKSQYQPMHVESSFELPGEVNVEGNKELFLLRGVFDRIEGNDGKEKVIVDYKSNPSNKALTEKSFASSVETYYSLQAICYSMAFTRLYGYSAEALRFENIESGVQYSPSLSKLKPEDAYSCFSQFIHGLKRSDFSPCHIRFQCDRCEFRNLCKYREM